ncbi:MAG: hypothetical protein ABIJ95_10305 [Pseudomonadota bacterium]
MAGPCLRSAPHPLFPENINGFSENFNGTGSKSMIVWILVGVGVVILIGIVAWLATRGKSDKAEKPSVGRKDTPKQAPAKKAEAPKKVESAPKPAPAKKAEAPKPAPVKKAEPAPGPAPAPRKETAQPVKAAVAGAAAATVAAAAAAAAKQAPEPEIELVEEEIVIEEETIDVPPAAGQDAEDFSVDIDPEMEQMLSPAEEEELQEVSTGTGDADDGFEDIGEVIEDAAVPAAKSGEADVFLEEVDNVLDGLFDDDL